MDTIITVYEVDMQPFKLRLMRDDLRMGLSMKGSIDDASGRLWATCRFVTSPDFPQFDEIQSLQLDELAARAVDILVNGGHEAIAKSRARGLVINFRMNARDHA